MFIRPRKHTAKDGSISISFQLLENSWNADKKRSAQRVVKNLGTCKIYKYDAARMTPEEYERFIARKYKAFLDAVKIELKDFEERRQLFTKIQKTIEKNNNYLTEGFDNPEMRRVYSIFNK